MIIRGDRTTFDSFRELPEHEILHGVAQLLGEVFESFSFSGVARAEVEGAMQVVRVEEGRGGPLPGLPQDARARHAALSAHVLARVEYERLAGRVDDVPEYPERLAALQARNLAPGVGPHVADVLYAVIDATSATHVASSGDWLLEHVSKHGSEIVKANE